MTESNAKPGAQLIDRVVLILDLVANSRDTGITLKDVCDHTELNKATCHRILSTLVGHNLLTKVDKGRRYRLGTKMLVYGAKAANGPGLRSQFLPAMQRLMEATGETVVLMARDQDDSVCIDRLDGECFVQTLTGAIGGYVPLGVGTGSLAMLSFLDEGERDAIIARNLPRIGTYASLTEARVRTLVGETAAQGYALDRGELLVGVAGISVPIFAVESGPVASLGLTFLSARLTPELIEKCVALLKEEVARVAPNLNPLDRRLTAPGRA
ncbi:IclR family transcriptional regulator [Paraburkholderia unamae]|uniref:IclR family transcriptional regulator n=1 Tax=Paraburkholderia unamae TaxID=219649 RepID=A0ABX5KNJ0_9BURK|nr:IclR family transcriptional regulator [Paraburkholderia unamae]PVX80088.1 IclR family transcriptional regulator [Paraburkholderia unamae]RAR52234.1 IclR family transcriptional regulator [Paraburkholderia unamae]CAG9268563.1 IclR family transcriptional regulator [Paraburkholderia unamae]